MGNFAEQNINAAQDKTQDDKNPKVLGSDDSPPNDNDFFDDMANAGTALAGLLAGGAAFVTGLYGGSPTPAAGTAATPAPSASETVVLERDRRREEDDNSDVADHQDLDRNNDTPGSDLANSDAMDQMNPSLENDYENGSDTENPPSALLDPPTSVDNDISTGQGAFQAPVESTQVTMGYDPLEGEKGGGEVRVYDRAELQSLSASKLNKLVTAELGKPAGELKKATDSEVIRRESTITTQITEINPAKKSEVKSLNEKVDSAFKEKLASAGKTWIDKATLDDVVKTLSGDPAFRQLTEPQSMKESRNQYEQATRDIQILNEQFKGNNGEAYQKALEPLIANFEKVQSKYLQDLTKYQENITKAIEKRDAGGNIKVEALKTLAPDLTKQVSSTRTIETRYEIYKDSEGNEVLVSNSNQEWLCEWR